ncbi:TPD1 protein homolog 1 isoform X1 [Selaginella moellendorffii]|uniref:TPD1 protein homolog 1 isoform X1 n=1 Tax=Selaginella moellendorffii TaxID=88036 RepID=UPI000D1C20EC|nr:TPD1 protein homolog 1 isoform X1 [Selaginella moellendorffii]|eukprot:XP_002969724.2 TPD1 protein homolog 1 isoform X1 [Selaginella moellendorffii]
MRGLDHPHRVMARECRPLGCSISAAAAAASLLLIALLGLVFLGSDQMFGSRPGVSISTVGVNSEGNATNASYHPFNHQIMRNRKLLSTADRLADSCTTSDISIFQGQSAPLPNGIPTFTVQIINLCLHDCSMSAVHVSCGWFASTKLVNPKIFRRLKYDDCLVNDGKAIKGGDSVNFQYANSFEYPMKVSSAKSCQ